jgi:hypothetical protein
MPPQVDGGIGPLELVGLWTRYRVFYKKKTSPLDKKIRENMTITKLLYDKGNTLRKKM